MNRRWRFIPALFLSACAFGPHGFVQPEGPYGEALAAATRYGSVLGNPDEIIEVIATRETRSFCTARTQRMALAVGVAEKDAPQYGGDVTEPLSGEVFFLAVNTADKSANDLDMASTRWALTLQTPSGTVVPTQIVRLRSQLDAVKALYPYAAKGYEFYRVTFPTTTAGPVTLAIAGPRNTLRLSFSAAFDTAPESR